jgi:hypothetical protein
MPCRFIYLNARLRLWLGIKKAPCANVGGRTISHSQALPMNNVRLQNFFTDTAARGRITFGDVRRLHRDYLPGGVSSREEAEMLLELDTRIGRADSAWTDWLVAAIVEFAVWSEPPIDGVESGTGEWLNGVLAAMSKTTKAGRKIAREVRRTADRVQRIDCIAVPAALPAVAEFNMNEFQLAA